MKKTYRLSILLLTLFLTNFIYGQSKVFDNLTMNSEILNMERNYAIYLPPDYETSSRSYPVLYLLHGLGDDQTGWIQFGEVKKIADNSIINGKATPMIIVMPDANTGRVGYFNMPSKDWMYEDFFFNELMPHVESKYRIKSEKKFRAISGLSMGGGGTFTYALHRLDLFSAAAPLSAATGSLNVEESLERIKRYGIEFTRAEMEFLLKTNHPLELIDNIPLKKLNSIRWFIDCGDDDYLYEDNSLIHIAFSKKGINHEYRVRDGAHTWTYWRESLPKVLEFISMGFHQY
ncbi:MAG: esterase family protein [Cryomorphaceae bacterium]|jgi:enterochelin esterase-like enzyme|nr:esterase family protein [Cryomorphaceae bacterium]MBT3503000.1 esterase family protein [Cryomorphaceae bacterium]MBT3689422.1 esterase family protein [Cryomorphaceae bacterium]MBT4221890.1 esterase family protein [Cryomorphaceae bacterium]MBT4293841.1 esterase family protein [Cryomorphaceae bacterium]